MGGDGLQPPTPEEQPDLLELAETARDRAKGLHQTLRDLVRRVKAENRAGRQLPDLNLKATFSEMDRKSKCTPKRVPSP